MLGEVFYYHRRNERVNIYDGCVAVPDLTRPYSRIFHLNDKSLVWPVCIDGNILMQSVDLSNIGGDQIVCSFFCASWSSNGCFVYVGCKPADPAETSRCHLHVYSLSATEEVSYLEDLKLGYKPLEMSEFILNIGKFLCILGSDTDIHIYEVDGHTGKLYRSSNAEVVKSIWKPVLGVGDSFCLRLLTENWGTGQQCISGFSDGYLYWHARRGHKDKSYADAVSVNSLKPELFWAAVLLDNAVTCVTLYGQSRSLKNRQRHLFEKLGVPFTCDRSEIVVAGLSNGSLLLLSSSLVENECTVLTGLDESTHGAVMALTTGDITGNSIDDIAVGYYDGTVVIYSVHVEFFPSPALAASSFREDPLNQALDGGGNRSQYENENMALVEEYRLSLPFSVVGLSYGAFLNEVDGSLQGNGEESASVGKSKQSTCLAEEDHLPSNVREDVPVDSALPRPKTHIFYGEQLAVLTSKDFRLFVNRHHSKTRQQRIEERVRTALMADLISELKAVG